MMKTIHNVILKCGKVLLVLCTLFSQLSFSLEVFADEVGSSLDEGKVVTGLEETTLEENLEDEEGILGDNEETSVDEDNNTGDDDKESSTESVTVTIDEEVAVVLGTFVDSLTVSMLKEALSEEYDQSIISVMDDGNEVALDAIVKSGMVLMIDDSEYLIAVLGDFDENGIVDDADLDILIEDILRIREEGEEDSYFDVSDITYLYASIKNTSWIEEVDSEDVLSFETSMDNDNVLVGDTFEIKLIINGFDKDFIDGIEGIVHYDESLLELEAIDVLKDFRIKGDKNEEGKFVYLLNNYINNDSSALLTLRFKAKAFGDAEVSVEDILIAKSGTYVRLEKDNNVIETVVSIAPAGMGGGDDSNITDDNDSENTQDDNVVDNSSDKDAEVVNTVNNVETVNNTKTTYVSLSRNNYISALEIKGYDIEFDKNTFEYSISVDNDVKSLDLSIVLDSSFASYVVNGNENFKEGKNTVEIVVTAEDGTERTYTITVDKKAKESSKSEDDETEEEESSNASKTVIIILIVLVIIGLIYVIFKDDEEEESSKSDNAKKVNDDKKKKK